MRARLVEVLTAVGVLATLAAGVASAQADGAIVGQAREKGTARALGGVQILVDGRVGAVSDTAGDYKVRSVRGGWHRVAARLIGYRGVVLDSVLVAAGGVVTVDFDLEQNPLELEPLVVNAPYDPVLDPLATASEQKITAADLRDLPVSTLGEALELSAGSRGHELPGRSRRGRVIHTRRPRDQEPGGCRERESGSQHPDRSAERGIVGHERLLSPVRAGAIRAGQRSHPRSDRPVGRTTGLRGRSAVRWIPGPRGRPLGSPSRRTDHRALRRRRRPRPERPNGR